MTDLEQRQQRAEALLEALNEEQGFRLRAYVTGPYEAVREVQVTLVLEPIPNWCRAEALDGVRGDVRSGDPMRK